MPLTPELQSILVCPQCKGELEYISTPHEELHCHPCALAYPIHDDIPVMLREKARSLACQK